MFEHKKEIWRIFEGFTDRDFYSVLADFFELSAISLRNSVHIGRTHGEYEERYARTIQKYTPEQFKMFATALGLLMDDIHASMDCGDIDSRCVHMTYLVLSVLGVPAMVRRGDALMLEYTEAWFTPAYVLNCAHFYRQIGDGTYPYTAVAVKSTSQPKTAPIVAPKTDAPKDEGGRTAATAQPKTDKHGQYVLEF